MQRTPYSSPPVAPPPERGSVVRRSKPKTESIKRNPTTASSTLRVPAAVTGEVSSRIDLELDQRRQWITVAEGRLGDATVNCSDAVDESGLRRSSAPVKPHKGETPKCV